MSQFSQKNKTGNGLGQIAPLFTGSLATGPALTASLWLKGKQRKIF